MATFEDRVLAVLRSLRQGEVVTYGEVAQEAGFPGAARAVGNVLHGTDADVPWWRVVTAAGRLNADQGGRQTRLLRAEGVEVASGRVRLPSSGVRAARPSR